MSTLIWTKDFEDNSLADMSVTNGGQTVAIQTSIYHGGTHALRVYSPSDVAQYALYNCGAQAAVNVGRFYMYFAAWPDNNDLLMKVANDSDSGYLYFNTSTKQVCADIGGSLGTYLNKTLSLTTWYCFDYKIAWNTTTWTMDFQIDGSAATQFSAADTAASGTNYVCFGSVLSASRDYYYDDIKLSQTAGDYPIGADTGTTLSVSVNEDRIEPAQRIIIG